MEDSLYRFFAFLSNKAILMTLLPSLLLNVIIDATKGLLEFKTQAGRVFILNGLLSLLGLSFGFIYHFLLHLPLDECILHSMAICGVSYVFYKVGIYDIFKGIINKLQNKFGVNKNE